jgi:chromosome segregation ATPase
MQINDDASRALETVRSYKNDLAAFDGRIKTLTEMTKDIVESMPESADIDELEIQLKEKKAQLKSRLMAKAEYNDAMQDLADERDARKSCAKHMSDALVVWYTITGAGQIELSDEVAQEVLVSAKLGKESLYQHSLFEKGTE